ncbi:hypothetical protein N7488_003326 [Penicillium malachiteum]|nr:hypothetical protein N7488_003326 [Penicillium malachiteum]
MLYLYFFHDNVGVQYENWVPFMTKDTSPLFVDFIVVKLEQDVMRERIFVECKRPRGDGQRAGEKAWENARKQMEKYMNTWKTQYQPPHPHYYAIINIGVETRFFVMNRRCCAKLKPFHDDPWTFSLWDDTVEVNDNLKEMCERISAS